MSVEVSELRDSVRQVVAGLDQYGAGAALWQQGVELGWLMAAVPESMDGLGAGDAGVAALHLELGAGLCAAPLMPALLGVDAICASEAKQQSEILTNILSGELITLSLADSAILCQDAVLSGWARALPSCDVAGQFLVWTEDHQLLVLIPQSQPGVQCTPRSSRDQTRALFDIELKNLSLGEQTVLAEGADAQRQISALLARRDIALAADGIGAATELLAMTVQHLSTRVQFRRPLAMFQALKHRCADLKVQIAAAEALLFDVLSKPLSEHSAMMVKQLSSATFARVAEESLQLHGGIGMADEHPCHLFLKRAMLNLHLGRGEDVYGPAVARGTIAA